MRPQDIVILLKIIALGERPWQLKDLARTLYISPSEVTESMFRSRQAQLISYNKEEVNRLSLANFMEHGFRYVFPATFGTTTIGLPTAHAHPAMKKYFIDAPIYVWPDESEMTRGIGIEPLYPNQSKAAKEDGDLYRFFTLADIIRIGTDEDRVIALAELKKAVLKG